MYEKLTPENNFFGGRGAGKIMTLGVEQFFYYWVIIGLFTSK
jgi:hypothetical protein